MTNPSWQFSTGNWTCVFQFVPRGSVSEWHLGDNSDHSLLSHRVSHHHLHHRHHSQEIDMKQFPLTLLTPADYDKWTYFFHWRIILSSYLIIRVLKISPSRRHLAMSQVAPPAITLFIKIFFQVLLLGLFLGSLLGKCFITLHNNSAAGKLRQNNFRHRLLFRRKSHNMRDSQTGSRPLLRPHLLLAASEACLPHLSQHRGLPPSHVPGTPPVLRHPGAACCLPGVDWSQAAL